MLRYLGDVLSGDFDIVDLIIYVSSIAFVVFCATPLHEFAHALIAVKLGDDTPRLRGRLTINPMAHIDIRGALMIFLFGFGYAKPVEVRMRRFKKPKRDMALVALAGPVSNILQSLVLLFIYNALYYFGSANENVMMVYMGMFFFYAAVININLAVFNLLPVPPLDGSRLVTALLPSKYYYKIMQYERYIMIGLFVLLFTGILTTPLSFISTAVLSLLDAVTSIPFV
ncbi:MAG: site-2 protease family protein [Ruminococcaceae bacterium]|nr:site-2 protease family protein [Oscillospiraceae bacterium]